LSLPAADDEKHKIKNGSRKTNKMEDMMLTTIGPLCSQLESQTKQAKNAYQERALPKALSLYDAALFTNHLIGLAVASDLKVDKAMTLRYMGLTEAIDRKQNYAQASDLVREVLDETELLKAQPELVSPRARARHTLMLLPDEDVEELFSLAKDEVEASALSQTKKDQLLSKLLNARALPIRRTDPELAITWFEEAVRLAPYGSADFGNPLQNASDCCKNMLKAASNVEEVEKWYQKGLSYLNQALDAYPAEEVGHRESTKGKIGQMDDAEEQKLAQLAEKQE